jgi:hypothetical protein
VLNYGNLNIKSNTCSKIYFAKYENLSLLPFVQSEGFYRDSKEHNNIFEKDNRGCILLINSVKNNMAASSHQVNCQRSGSQEAQARFARARLCLPYNEGRKETLRPK